MQNPAANDFCSRYFQYRELLFCGETWQQHQPDNLPLQLQSWLDLTSLAVKLLDPITEQFNKPVLTYGFCGQALQKLILQKQRPQIAPKLDQHAASELNRYGKLICPRAGAAVDLFIPGLCSFQLATWITRHLPFDRLYLYGVERAVHLSFHQEPQRQIILLKKTHWDKLIPQKLSLDNLQKITAEGQK